MLAFLLPLLLVIITYLMLMPTLLCHAGAVGAGAAAGGGAGYTGR